MRHGLRTVVVLVVAGLALTASAVPAGATLFPGPEITSISVGPRFLPRVFLPQTPGTYPDAMRPFTLRFAGTSTALYYQWREVWAPRMIGAQVTDETWAGPTEWSAQTSFARQVVEGSDCYQVRARDAYGHVGPWSATACVTLPSRGDELVSGNCGQSMSAFEHERAQTCTLGPVHTWYRQRGSAVRLGYWSGPKAGSFDVYLGSRKIGHVRATSSTKALHHVTLPVHGTVTGYLKLAGTSGIVQIEDFSVLP